MFFFMVVLQKSDDVKYQELAASIADDRGERLVSSVSEIQPGDTVLYVDPPTKISESTLRVLYSKVAENELDGVGIITGRTHTEAKALAYREEEGDDKHAILIRGRNKTVTCDDDDVTVLSRDEVTAENLQEVCADGVSSLSMRLKARDIHAFMSDGLICGVPSNPNEFDFDGVQPSCIVDGERDCIYSGDILPAESVAVPHMFLSGCSSPLANNHAELPVNLGLSFLSGAVSLIAPFRPISIHQYHAAFNYSLFRAGYTAAERVFLLNKTAHHAGMSVNQYVLFGHPEAVASNSTEQRFDIEYSISDDEYRISINGVDAHVLDFSVPGDLFDDEQERFFLRMKFTDQLDKPMFYVAFRDGEQIRIVVWSWGRIESDRLDFELSSSRVLEESPYVPILDDVAARIDVGLIGGKASRQFEDAWNRITGAVASHRHEPFDVCAHESTRNRLSEARDGLRRARETLTDVIHDRQGGLLQEEYSSSMYTADLSILEDGCPYCNRDIYVQTATDVYQRLERSLGVCPFHVYVFDTPSADGDLAYPTLDGDLSTIRYGEEREFEVSFTNPQSRQIEATIAPRTMPPGDQSKIISPARKSVEIPANETTVVSFTLDTAELDFAYTTGDRWLEATVVTDDLQVYNGIRTFFTTT